MSTPANRYHVTAVYGGTGELVDAHARKADAFSHGRRVKAADTSAKVEIFDSMAHKGARRLWEIT